MSPLATAAQAAPMQAAPSGARAAGHKPTTSHAACLLLSHDNHRRLWLRAAAQNAGWRVADFPSAAESMVYAVRNATPLALLDLPRDPRQREGFDDLIRVLRSGAGNLLVVCDDGAAAESELWARRHGAWMYLPETTEQSDLALVFGEAKSALEKLNRAGFSATGVG